MKKTYSLRALLATVGFFLVIITSITALEWQQLHPEQNTWPLASILNSFAQQRTINENILKETSLKKEEIVNKGRINTFFSPYLQLPEDILSLVYQLEPSNITIYEIKKNAFDTIAHLRTQNTQEFEINLLNQNTFYLTTSVNNQPEDSSSANKIALNRLAIIINSTLFGFEYPSQAHEKVLELIDELQKI